MLDCMIRWMTRLHIMRWLYSIGCMHYLIERVDFNFIWFIILRMCIMDGLIRPQWLTNTNYSIQVYLSTNTANRLDGWGPLTVLVFCSVQFTIYYINILLLRYNQQSINFCFLRPKVLQDVKQTVRTVHNLTIN